MHSFLFFYLQLQNVCFWTVFSCFCLVQFPLIRTTLFWLVNMYALDRTKRVTKNDKDHWNTFGTVFLWLCWMSQFFHLDWGILIMSTLKFFFSSFGETWKSMVLNLEFNSQLYEEKVLCLKVVLKQLCYNSKTSISDRAWQCKFPPFF